MKALTIHTQAPIKTQTESIFNDADFQQIYQRIKEIRSNAQRRWGKMNVHQMLNHLKVATASGLNTYQVKDESTWLWRNVVKFLALRLLKRFPKNAKAAAGFKSEIYLPIAFEREKQQALLTLQQAHDSNNQRYPHPMFGPMSKNDWGRLVFRHFDHHLRQFSH